MKTLKREYLVTTLIGECNEEETFNTMDEVNEHIKREITWFNSNKENELNNGYTTDDFRIEEVSNELA